jgi:hypothetical protein
MQAPAISRIKYCPKCGGSDINTIYHWTDNELIKKCSCTWEWREKPNDFKEEASK